MGGRILMGGFENAYTTVLEELKATFESINESEIEELITIITNSDQVFFVGVGRVLLSLKSIAKRWSHLGIKCVVVGDITEPAIKKNDVLIVGSGSGESIIPLEIAKKAKDLQAVVVHIGSNGESSISKLSDLFVRIPVQTKLYLDDEIPSSQPMTSLFEQMLLLLGDVVGLMIIKEKSINLDSLWEFHANLE
ncbi:6-phospho-3-hexuloisomerase [Falseniella ignava]|uniref:6-phospho 3-hexuloisomerase n=1 Tax=Falseniella ignava CCUG 37419 TaxID=883112 RepID=K1LUI3_9LACT|nr:6-phospho-3-hexuloisomerase [Falseniella ignava]EKB55787.1 6-phospho 3-hexuloisomerase [Falseniella ignava CCUG 37419]